MLLQVLRTQETVSLRVRLLVLGAWYGLHSLVTALQRFRQGTFPGLCRRCWVLNPGLFAYRAYALALSYGPPSNVVAFCSGRASVVGQCHVATLLTPSLLLLTGMGQGGTEGRAAWVHSWQGDCAACLVQVASGSSIERAAPCLFLPLLFSDLDIQGTTLRDAMGSPTQFPLVM